MTLHDRYVAADILFSVGICLLLICGLTHLSRRSPEDQDLDEPVEPQPTQGEPLREKLVRKDALGAFLVVGTMIALPFIVSHFFGWRFAD